MPDVFDDLLGLPGAGMVGQANLAEFLAAPGAAVIFFAGDSLRRMESTDVAVVLRELLRNRTGVRLGVVDRRDEGALMQKLGVVVFPALVLIREGQVAEIIARMRDWPVYAQAFDRLLGTGSAAAPVASPTISGGHS